jgi:hypothetical protein
MKKLFVLFLVFVFGITIATAEDSQFYAKDVFIAKITACDKGYRVIYKTNLSNLVTVYVPIEWFYRKKLLRPNLFTEMDLNTPICKSFGKMVSFTILEFLLIVTIMILAGELHKILWNRRKPNLTP